MAPSKLSWPRLQGISPLLQVYDMPTSVDFYTRVMGFVVTQHSPGEGTSFDWCSLERDGISLMLNTRYESDSRPSAPDPSSYDTHGDTCIFLGCKDLDTAYQTIAQQGWPVEPPTTAPYGMRQLTVRDPDGYGLCLQWATDGSWG